MDTVVHPYNGILLRNKKEQTTDIYNSMDESQTLCYVKEAKYKRYKMCDPTYRKL